MCLSIVIPTVRYMPSLDEAIRSVFDNVTVDFTINVSVNNQSLDSFLSSRYIDHCDVNWLCTNAQTVPIWDSFNIAVESAGSEWIYILSDDDLILPGFLKGVDLKKKDSGYLYATKIIVEDHMCRRESCSPSQEQLNNNNPLDLFFAKQVFHNHISLFVFNIKMFHDVGGFQRRGYPNGYFVDTVFHSHLLANSTHVEVSDGPVFLRKQTSNQGSAKFYLNRIVNSYIHEVVEGFWSNDKCREYLRFVYGNQRIHRKHLFYQRFGTEISKLNNRVYNQSAFKAFLDTSWLSFNAIFTWRTDFSSKKKIISIYLGYCRKALKCILKRMLFFK
ncbi:nucleotide-diphospho-sugar transferase [Synechococcus sp. RS9907]|nr:nucleotide-diphospho-sugar transferase [Synechococcus sp. RS9907]